MSASEAMDPAEVEAKVAGSSFYAGMRVLPKAERAAMYAIYAFCRAVDDIADDQVGAPADRRAALDAWRRDLDGLYRGRDAGRAAFLTEAVRRFHLDQADFLAVIDGMQMDVDQDIRAPSMAELDLYCDRVASAVGRLSVKVFGMESGPGRKLAHELGRALQLTNILRDLDEDAAIGRLYLPCELLDEAGVESSDPAAAIADPRVDRACRKLAKMAHGHYAEADRVMKSRPAGRLVAPKLMSAVYSKILARMEDKGWAPPRERIRVGKGELLWLVLRRGLLG